jgi:hypothetical protein
MADGLWICVFLSFISDPFRARDAPCMSSALETTRTASHNRAHVHAPIPVRLVIIVVFLAALATGAAARAPLGQVFLHPPDEAKPRGYWVWPHGNFD